MFLLVFLIIIFIIESFCYFKLKNTNEKNFDYFRDIPSNLKPAEVGFMVKHDINANDIIAILLDLYKREFLNINYQIIDGKEKCVLSLTEKDRFTSLNDYENYLLDQIFNNTNIAYLDDVFKDKDFNILFRSIANMIDKRVDINSKHHISIKRLFSKVNYLSNYLVLGFAFFFSSLYLITNNVLISIVVSYVINTFLFLIINSFLNSSDNRIESKVYSYTIFSSLIYFSLLLMVFLLSDMNYEVNSYIEIINIIFAFITICLSFIDFKNKKINFADMLFLIFAIVSIIFVSPIGVCLSIIYISNQIYRLSPKHIYLDEKLEIDKWIGLKNFLNDFSLMSEKTVHEVELWDKYLIYAISMGVNKDSVNKYLSMPNIKLDNRNIVEKFYKDRFI